MQWKKRFFFLLAFADAAVTVLLLDYRQEPSSSLSSGAKALYAVFIMAARAVGISLTHPIVTLLLLGIDRKDIAHGKRAFAIFKICFHKHSESFRFSYF